MQIILAVEPDRRQAAQLSAIVRRVGAELVLADTTERALDVLGARVPDLVLVPALLSPQDDAALAAALRVIAAAAHVRTLSIPVLGSSKEQSTSGGLLSRWRRGRAESPAPHGCDPAVFAEQITAYLKEAAAERAERHDDLERAARIADRSQPSREPSEVAQTANAFEAGGPSAFEAYAGAETFAAETFVPAETFAPVETFAAPTAFSAAERYAGAATSEAATYDTTLSNDEQDANVDTGSPVLDLSTESGSPVLDLSSELDSAAPPANDQNLYDGESFGTYTLPPFDEVQAEAGASLDASPPIDTPPAFDTPMAQSSAESPIDIDERILLEEPFIFEPPAIFESIEFEAAESLAAFEPPVAIESPVAFKALPSDESPKVVERAAAVQPPPVEAPRPAASASRPRASAVAKPKPAPVVKAPVAVERSEVLELATPAGMSPWRAWPRIEGVPIEVPGIPAVAKADAPDWTELMASLRQDMERRRTQDHRPPATRKPRSKSDKPAVDEWGLFDPEQCGFSALLAKLDEITTTSQ